jgi:hypothetical protein
MANTSSTKKTTTKASTVKTTVDDSAVVKTEKIVVAEEKIVETKKPLKDDDEILVVSLIPNVSYKDAKNNDFYEWNEVGHEEPMNYATLKDMNRNYKSYFKDLWLKPMDDRVVKAFGLESTYKNYADLMSGDIYTLDNIDAIKDKFDALPPRGIKLSIVSKIKDMVANGEISDVKVVKHLEKLLQIDLFDLLDL